MRRISHLHGSALFTIPLNEFNNTAIFEQHNILVFWQLFRER